MTPTARTLRELRRHGFTCQTVERWNPFAHVRIDLLGCIDIIAVKPGSGIWGIQATSVGSFATHLHKIKNEPRLKAWLSAGGGFLLVGWAKRECIGRRKWQPRWQEIKLNDVEESFVESPLTKGQARVSAGDSTNGAR